MATKQVHTYILPAQEPSEKENVIPVVLEKSCPDLRGSHIPRGQIVDEPHHIIWADCRRREMGLCKES